MRRPVCFLNAPYFGADNRKVNLKHRRHLCALGAAALAVAPAPGTVSVAGATDLEGMREEAQAVADEVAGLERSLAALDAERERLAGAMERAGRRLAILEAERHDAGAALEDAAERYAQRAVEAYKSGAGGSLALLLSAESMGEMLTLAEAAATGAELDARSLRRWQRARRSISAAQDALEDRKERLLRAQARVEEVTSEIGMTLQDRRLALAEMMDRIDAMEALARRAARRRERRTAAAADAPSGAGPQVSSGGAAGTGFVATGVTFEGLASWYGPGFEGQTTASGDVFHAGGMTAASLDLPLGTWLRVSWQRRSVVVLVNDRGPYIDGRVLDLSRGAAEVLGFTGLAWVTAEVILPPA